MTRPFPAVRTTSAASRTCRLPAIAAAWVWLGLASGPAVAHGDTPEPQIPPVSASNVLSEALPHLPGQRITLRVVDIPPGGASPSHRHAGSVAVYVLSGAIRSQLRGQAPAVYRAGESFFEPSGTVHQRSENASTSEAARILAIFVAGDGEPLITYDQ
ncbi:MAG: cupin domain-containing protein [Elusimicrobia bacterium]|jgi:quercetin dioxygenase-like cupin family protein|nr:MAG: cupin domain-containing protein [Elusimicrobiota bacterium]